MFLTEFEASENYIDLFTCLSEKEKARGKRKGIRMAKRDNFIYKVRCFIKKKLRIVSPSKGE